MQTRKGHRTLTPNFYQDSEYQKKPIDMWWWLMQYHMLLCTCNQSNARKNSQHTLELGNHLTWAKFLSLHPKSKSSSKYLTLSAGPASCPNHTFMNYKHGIDIICIKLNQHNTEPNTRCMLILFYFHFKEVNMLVLKYYLSLTWFIHIVYRIHALTAILNSREKQVSNMF